MNEQTTEETIVAKNLTTWAVTQGHVHETIVSAQYHVFEGTTLTVCCLTLRNGFHVVGESACVSRENYVAEIGKQLAYQNAEQKVWPLEGYLLRERLAASS